MGVQKVLDAMTVMVYVAADVIQIVQQIVITIVQVDALTLAKVVQEVAMGLAPQAVDKVDVVLVKVLQLDRAEVEVALVAQVDAPAVAEDAEADVLVVLALVQVLAQVVVKVDALLVEDVQDVRDALVVLLVMVVVLDVLHVLDVQAHVKVVVQLVMVAKIKY